MTERPERSPARENEPVTNAELQPHTPDTYGDDAIRPFTEACVKDGCSDCGVPTPLRGASRYRAVFEHSPQAIVLLDPKGTFIEVNPKLKEWLGYGPDDVIGRNIMSVPFIAPSSKALAFKNFFFRMAGHRVPPYTLTFRTKRGETKFGRIDATALRDGDGQIVANLIIVSDVTNERMAEKRLAESARKMEEIHAALFELNSCTNEDDVCSAMVNAVRRTLGFPVCLVYASAGDRLVLRRGCIIPSRTFRAPDEVTEGPIQDCRRSGSSVFLDADAARASANGNPNVAAGVCIPIGAEGVLVALTPDGGAINEEDVRFLQMLSGHAAAWARTMRLSGRLEGSGDTPHPA